MVGHHIVVRTCTSISLLSIGGGGSFFMRDRSYQWLKDATLFCLLSDKSAEKLEGEYSNFCQNGQISNFWPSWAWLKLAE